MDALVKHRRSFIPRLSGIFLIAALVLNLWWIRVDEFITASRLEFWKEMFDWFKLLSAGLVWLSGALWLSFWTANLLRGKPTPAKLTREQLVSKLYPIFVLRVLRPASESILTMFVLFAAALWAAVQVVTALPPPLPPSGPIVVTPSRPGLPKTKQFKHVYIADSAHGSILIYNEQAVQLPGETILLGDRLSHAKPTCIALAPRYQKILVTDADAGKLYVIDAERKVVAIAVGHQPHCVVVSSDERKAYVSNEQPAPYGTVTVIDIDKNMVLRTINSLNCPEGLAVSRDGRRLYVATQCGAGQDPLLVIDTATDKLITTIPNVAVGIAPTVSPDGKRIYVARSDPTKQGHGRQMLTLFSSIDYAQLLNKEFEESIQGMAFSPDGKYILVATPTHIEVLNAESLERTNQISTPPPFGLAVSESGALYVLSKNANGELSLFFSGLTGLLDPIK
jgi:DNA-binding beta-propeller fold protein YncE